MIKYNRLPFNKQWNFNQITDMVYFVMLENMNLLSLLF